MHEQKVKRGRKFQLSRKGERLVRIEVFVYPSQKDWLSSKPETEGNPSRQIRRMVDRAMQREQR